MAERAAYLVDHVFPDVPVRQWVISLPARLRYHLAWDHGLLGLICAVSRRPYPSEGGRPGLIGVAMLTQTPLMRPIVDDHRCFLKAARHCVFDRAAAAML